MIFQDSTRGVKLLVAFVLGIGFQRLLFQGRGRYTPVITKPVVESVRDQSIRGIVYDFESPELPISLWKHHDERQAEGNTSSISRNILEGVVCPLDVHNFWKEMRIDKNSTTHVYPYGQDVILPAECANKSYGKLSELPTATVILSFHDSEKLVHLLHTLHSLFQRSPPQLLKEVVLIDDNTQKEDLKEVLSNYADAIFGERIRLVRSDHQLGLIQARLLGGRLATSDVIICLDSHMEVQEHWLEPILYEMKKDPRTMAASYLDWMKPGPNGSWVYEHGSSTLVTHFGWDLSFGFQEISQMEREKRSDPTEPVRTPLTVGIFAIAKEFFHEIGELDEGMHAWGGENIDLALRVWYCGGRVVNIPCSFIAHLEEPGQREYRYTKSWTDAVERNYVRVLEAMFGDYKKYPYMYLPNTLNRTEGVGDIASRIAIREGCPRNFTWFLHNVSPWMEPPDLETFAWGGIRNPATDLCLDYPYIEDWKLFECHYRGNQAFMWNLKGELRFHSHVFDAVPWAEKHFKLWAAPAITHFGSFKTARWIHWKDGPMHLNGTDLCLQAWPAIEGQADSKDIRFMPCNYTNPFQQWRFKEYTDKYTSLVVHGQYNVHTSDPFPRHLVAALEKQGVFGNKVKDEIIGNKNIHVKED